MTAISGPLNWDTNNAKPHVTSHKTAVELGRDPDRDKPKFDPVLDRKSERSTGKIRTTDSNGRTVIVTLDELMDDVLLRLSLVSEGATAKLGRKVSGSKAGSANLCGASDLGSELRRLEGDYTSATTHRARLRVIKDAQDRWLEMKYAPKADPSLVKGTREWRMRVAAEPGTYDVVASRFRISKREVSACRKEFKA